MNIDTDLVERINKAKAELEITTPEDKPNISLSDWFAYLKNEPRVADKKEAEDYKQKLEKKGLI